VDGGIVNVPEDGFANARGEWITKGVGVKPGIEEVLKMMKPGPKRLPSGPSDPVKAR
jgi:hypothetical protein